MRTCIKCNAKISWWQADYTDDSGRAYHLECWESKKRECDMCHSDLGDSYWKTKDDKRICKTCKEKHERAFREYNYLIEESSSPETVALNRAIYFYKIDNYNEAKKYLDEFVSLNKNNFSHWLIAAQYLESMGAYDKAISYLHMAMKLHPGDEAVRKVNYPYTNILLYLNMVGLLMKTMHYKEAIPFIIDALKLEECAPINLKHYDLDGYSGLITSFKKALEKAELSSAELSKYEKVINHHSKIFEERHIKYKKELRNFSDIHKVVRDIDDMLK